VPIPDGLGVFLNTGILSMPSFELERLIGWQDDLLTRFRQVSFDPKPSSQILERALLKEPSLKAFFDAESVREGGRIATHQLLYGLHQDRSRWTLSFFHAGTSPIEIPLSASALPSVVPLLRAATHTGRWENLAQELDDCRVLQPWLKAKDTRLSWTQMFGPGIQRLEHASLLISSREARILIDPISLAVDGPSALPGVELAPSTPHLPVDAILITHGHLDHWHIPSILHHAGDASTPVVVPRIPFPSLLSQDEFVQSMRDIGQQVCDPAWNDSLRIKDMEIDVLPFFGEQPTVEGPVPPQGVRNWGNCYRIGTPDFSIFVFVDCGEDPMGTAAEVLQASVAQRGPPDIVVSCCRELREAPFWQGLFTFWMTLPFRELQQLVVKRGSGLGPSITLGPDGVASVCAAASVPYFAPYAHGFAGVGKEILDIGWGNHEPPESEMLNRIKRSLAGARSSTDVINWRPGDILRPRKYRGLHRIQTSA
jgi:L-ascorbate metabolism protein UlaG (beta-lactamase superfamily)